MHSTLKKVSVLPKTPKNAFLRQKKKTHFCALYAFIKHFLKQKICFFMTMHLLITKVNMRLTKITLFLLRQGGSGTPEYNTQTLQPGEHVCVFQVSGFLVRVYRKLTSPVQRNPRDV